MIVKIEKYGASYCGPCKVLDKTLDKITDVEVIKYDIEEEEERATTNNIKTVPTLLFIDENNDIIERTTGAVPLAKIMEIIKNHG